MATGLKKVRPSLLNLCFLVAIRSFKSGFIQNDMVKPSTSSYPSRGVPHDQETEDNGGNTREEIIHSSVL